MSKGNYEGNYEGTSNGIAKGKYKAPLTIQEARNVIKRRWYGR